MGRRRPASSLWNHGEKTTLFMMLLYWSSESGLLADPPTPAVKLAPVVSPAAAPLVAGEGGAEGEGLAVPGEGLAADSEVGLRSLEGMGCQGCLENVDETVHLILPGGEARLTQIHED